MEKVSLGNVGFRDSVRISDDVSERQDHRQGQPERIEGCQKGATYHIVTLGPLKS